MKEGKKGRGGGREYLGKGGGVECVHRWSYSGFIHLKKPKEKKK